jgi:Fe-S-cluster-containing dehydrogenase component
MSAKSQPRKFVSVDPGKCIGCGICEYACTIEKGEGGWSPMSSRIRVVRMAPVFNFALSCRGCTDAKCVKACPEKAISQSQENNLLIIDEKNAKAAIGAYKPATTEESPYMLTLEKQLHVTFARANQNAKKHAQKKP